MSFKLALLGAIAFIIALIYLLGFYHKAGATQVVKVDICHCEQPDSESPFQCQTLNLPIAGALAHLQQHSADYRGACVVPTPSCTPTPEVTCEGEDCITPTVTPSPTGAEVTPTLTPTPTAPPAGHGDGLSDHRSDGRSDGLSSSPPQQKSSFDGTYTILK